MFISNFELNGEMQKFLKKIFRFLVLLFIPFFLIILVDFFVIGNQFLGNYQASLIDKVNRLQHIQSPKIILIGNSNVCFGMQSDLIEKTFGMPVVDMGLHGGLGNAFHENMVKLGVSEGDIVIVCHSLFSDDGNIPNPDLAWITLEHHWQLWPIVTIQDIPALLQSFPGYFKRAFENYLHGQRDNVPKEKTSYSRNAFNEYGDIVARFDDRYEFSKESVPVPEINDTCINRLNRLNHYVKEHGAILLVAGYPIGDGEFTPDRTKFDAFEQELRDKLECDVISHYTDYFIPYRYFYNAYLHLNEDGARMRTELLIRDLKLWMEKHNSF